MSSSNKSKPALRNLKTRKTVRIRLVLVAVLLISMVTWGVYAFERASEAAAVAAAEAAKETTISSDLYDLPDKVLVELDPGDYYFVKSHGNPPYYTVLEYDAEIWRNVTRSYVFVSTDVAPSWSYGYSGPISMLVSMDTNGVVLNVLVLEYYENRPGVAFEAAWLSTLVGKSVLGNYSIGRDIDGVTGATYTAYAIVDGIREGGRAVLKDAESSSAPPKPPPPWTEQLITAISNLTTTTDYLQSLILLALIGASIVGITKKIELLRYGVLLSSLLLMEFMGTRMISIQEILNLRNLTMPPLQGNLFWYVLFGSAFLLSLVWGRVYCGWLCPFGAATEFLNKLASWFVRLNVKMPLSMKARVHVVKSVLTRHLSKLLPARPAMLDHVKSKVTFAKGHFDILLGRPLQSMHRVQISHGKAFLIKYLVLGVIVGSVMITGDMVLTGVEPFATFFLAEGTIWMWLLLFAVLVASMRVNRVFCQYICPTGAMLSLAARLRVKEIIRSADCAACSICKRDCSMGAIRGTHISAADCLNCGACERNYQKNQGCPHWLRLRSIGPTA